MTCAKFYALQLSLGILFEEELVLLLFAEIIFVNMLYGRGSNPFFYFILCTIEFLSYDESLELTWICLVSDYQIKALNNRSPVRLQLFIILRVISANHENRFGNCW